MLHGGSGESAAFAMKILVAFAEATGATSLLDISGAHIDGCLYHGQVSLDFVERLVAGGGRVRVPTTLNVGAIDLIHPELIRMTSPAQAPARRLMKAHEELGCVPSFTCAPYQTRFRPSFGEQIAWGESNAIVFANSVIGARTNRYGDFIDLCCAMTGRAPASGLHLAENRRGQVLYRLTGFRRHAAADRLPVRGRRPADRQLEPRSHPGDRRAAAAALGGPAQGAWRRGRLERFSRAVPCGWHNPGGGYARWRVRRRHAGRDVRDPALRRQPCAAPAVNACPMVRRSPPCAWARRISRAMSGAGCWSPWSIVEARSTKWSLACRSTSTPAGQLWKRSNWKGSSTPWREHNVIAVTDTCTYLTPILERLDGAVMTNSGKWAHYAPGNLGVQAAFGELEDCVASAAAGRVVRV